MSDDNLQTYIIVKATSCEELARKVSQTIAEDKYVPFGGGFVDDMLLYQPMITRQYAFELGSMRRERR